MPITLSRIERYSISNQLRILEALYPDEANEFATQREAIERGYEMIYSWDFDHIYDGQDVMTEEESREVWDTMDMFDAIDRCANEEQKGGTLSKFSGYDGNNEAKFMAFARFTVERLNRFEYLPLAHRDGFNAHMPMRDVYRRMFLKWQEIPPERRFDMTAEEVEAVLVAATPEG